MLMRQVQDKTGGHSRQAAEGFMIITLATKAADWTLEGVCSPEPPG